MATGVIEFTIQQGDITTFDADVVALKYAQNFYGADEAVAIKLTEMGVDPKSLQPLPGAYQYTTTVNSIKAPHVLFVGVHSLFEFGYEQIRELSTQVLKILAEVAPHTRHLAMTIHGVGFGLDEVEALFAQFAGYKDAIESGQLPLALKYITIVERNPARVQRLRQALDNTLAGADYAIKSPLQWSYQLIEKLSGGMAESKSFRGLESLRGHAGSPRPIEKAGIASAAKPHVFVAMPFMKEMDDVFYYGIQQPVRDAGLLCERIDQEAFVGDILDRVKKKIETASVVIAELTGANPNVYLEVGYAWGKERPTILLTKNEQELRFDIRGHRCLKYESIRYLEEALSKELRELMQQGMI